ADGKYVVQVRDMLYRGTPSSIYRLSIGSLPYGQYLYPAGGRSGQSASATVYSQNMPPQSLLIPLPADAPEGVRDVTTAAGTFKFVVGQYPEYVSSPGMEVQPVTLPVTLNGRIEAEGATDRYRFTLAKEALGPYRFQAYAEQIGSPLEARLTLKNAKGQVLASAAQQRTRDPRLDYTFSQPGEYTLEISNTSAKFGPEYVYRVSAGPAEPDFRLSAGPDNPNLGPGSSVYLAVRVNGRVGIPGDIEISVEGLPPGVTASPTRLRPDENQGFITLSAAADAKPGSFSRVRVVGRATVNGKVIEREASVYEVYRINNNPQNLYRSEMVVTVGPEIGWTVSLEPGAARMSPESGPVTFTARLNRKGAEGDIPFAIVGVPQGVQGPRSLLFKRGTSELTFTLTPTQGGVFAQRGSNAPSAFLLALVNGRDGEGMMMCSPAISVAISPAAEK
ncbi:MAG TPA: hypothetical protein VFU47_12245, partial [Armatimonadota bacterium]|nr:hypothetical protein [Armatimonadota bacterium]